MIDNPCISKIVAMNTAETVLTHVQQFLNHNTTDDEYHVAIGISNGTYYQRDFNLAKEQTSNMADAIMNEYLSTSFEGGRHARRVAKIPVQEA